MEAIIFVIRENIWNIAEPVIQIHQKDKLSINVNNKLYSKETIWFSRNIYKLRISQ